MKFQVEIDTDNAAFGDTSTDQQIEIARLLRLLAYELEAYEYEEASGLDGTIRLRDTNGNTVGKAYQS